MKIKTTTIKDLDDNFVYKMKELIDDEDNVIMTRIYNKRIGYRTIKNVCSISPMEELLLNYELDNAEDFFYEREDNIDFEEEIQKKFGIESKDLKVKIAKRSVK